MLTSPARRAAPSGPRLLAPRLLAPRLLHRAAGLLTALLLSLAGSFALAAPAQAADLVVTITAEGVSPKVLTVAGGDTITFVNEDSSFGYRAVNTSDNWEFDSGPIGLLPGARYSVPQDQLPPGAGTYTYRVAEDEPFQGSVVLPATTRASPGPGPGRTPAASPRPGGSPAPAASTGPSASPSPAATGGTGDAALPPLAGGFGSADVPALPLDGGAAPPPTLAGELPVAPGAPVGPAPQTAGAPTPPAAAPSLAVAGDLPGAGTARRYGLPAALAAVLAVGVASLLVRLLLAEPVARLGRAASAAPYGPDPLATVD